MQVVVDMSDMKLSKNAEDILVTYSLGSCIGITLYDPVVMVGGILHFMLPDSSIDIEKSRNNPFIYADTGKKGKECVVILSHAPGLYTDSTEGKRESATRDATEKNKGAYRR